MWQITAGSRNYDLYTDANGNANVLGMAMVYGALSESDFKSGGYIVLKTFFKDIYVPLYPNREESRTGDNPVCYSVDIRFRQPSKLAVDLSPGGYTISPGTRVTATYTLTYYNGTPIPNEKIYVDLDGADVWKLSPEGISRDYIFSIQEISSSEEQQKKLQNRLSQLGQTDIADKLAGAQYTQNSENKITITGENGAAIATIETIGDVCNMTTAKGDAINARSKRKSRRKKRLSTNQQNKNCSDTS